MSGTKGRWAAVPWDLGLEGRFPSLKFAVFWAEEQSIHPSFSAEKCREAICSAPLLLSGLCRTQFSTVNRKLRPEMAPIFEVGFGKLHPQIAGVLHPVCTSRSLITFPQHAVAIVKFGLGKPGVYFLKCTQQWQLSPLNVCPYRGQRRFLTLLI